MKTLFIIAALAFCGCILGACTGDHTSQTGKDTVINTYHTAKDTANIDTSKAVSRDNSGSGGTGHRKDTIKK